MHVPQQIISSGDASAKPHRSPATQSVSQLPAPAVLLSVPLLPELAGSGTGGSAERRQPAAGNEAAAESSGKSTPGQLARQRQKRLAQFRDAPFWSVRGFSGGFVSGLGASLALLLFLWIAGPTDNSPDPDTGLTSAPAWDAGGEDTRWNLGTKAPTVEVPDVQVPTDTDAGISQHPPALDPASLPDVAKQSGGERPTGRLIGVSRPADAGSPPTETRPWMSGQTPPVGPTEFAPAPNYPVTDSHSAHNTRPAAGYPDTQFGRVAADGPGPQAGAYGSSYGTADNRAIAPPPVQGLDRSNAWEAPPAFRTGMLPADQRARPAPPNYPQQPGTAGFGGTIEPPYDARPR